MKKKLIIFSGIPLSGKSTYANLLLKNDDVSIISRDTLREQFFGKKYKFSNTKENFITLKFDELIEKDLKNEKINSIILDNTHCKESYLDNLIKIYGKNFDIYIIFFDTKLIKAYILNIFRYFKSGKWIPFKIIKNMYYNYNKINKLKYKNLILSGELI